ncbi:MAG: VWA domain-containing protein [Pyrinomonadaceae bacterium]|nr:VWA domain-containing protein [Pyrinomonadaceae bacterium]
MIFKCNTQLLSSTIARWQTSVRSAILLFGILTLFFVWTVALQAQQTERTERPRRVGAPPVTSPAAPTPPPPAPPSPNADSSAPDDEDEVVRVETDLVTVPVVVTNTRGGRVAALRAEDFRLYEDNRSQTIASFSATETPFEVALLLDTSGSTRAEVNLIRRAAHVFINALRAGDRVAILAFNTAEDAGDRLAAVDVKIDLTSDREKLHRAVDLVGASSGTPYYDALERVANRIFRDLPREEVRGRRALVALTDGVDSSSDEDYREARAALLNRGLICYFVQINTEDFVEERLLKDCADDGTLRLSRTQLQRYRRIFVPRADASEYLNFCRLGEFQRMQISRDLYNLARREMSELAKESGGKTFPTVDLVDARRAFAQVAAEIGTQYSLSYYPTNKERQGRFRKIRVEVKGIAGALVRAREGYTR